MLDEYFGLSEKQTAFKIELVADLTTFLTTAYMESVAGVGQGKGNKTRHVGHRGFVGTVSHARSDPRLDRAFEIYSMGKRCAVHALPTG